MIKANTRGEIISWESNDGDIIRPHEEEYSVSRGGSQFFAPYFGNPPLGDSLWENLVPTQKSHLVAGKSRLLDYSRDGRKRQIFSFDYSGSTDYPWQYTAEIALKELSPNEKASRYAATYFLKTERAKHCNNQKRMPYRAALQTFFILKQECFAVEVNDVAIIDESKYDLHSMVFHPLTKEFNFIVLRTGNRTITINCSGADDLMIWSDDLEYLCIETVSGAKHDKSLEPGEYSQLMCGFTVTHT